MTELLTVGSPVVLAIIFALSKYVINQIGSFVTFLIKKRYELKELKLLLDSGVDNAVVTNDYIAFGSKQELGTLNSNSPQ
ncbi:MAG: hypothetical protein ACLS20_05880 [Faecalimonas umbilicata]|jgi:hypothetical protein|uniref:hypothetical protein n=1 Tax=Faecalimonas umbilicata TaxID=1912855 RepID=UPI0039961CE0